MVAVDDTMEDLSLLYHVIGGNENYEIWDETRAGAGLGEITHELEQSREYRVVNGQMVIDYWSGLEDIGLLDENWQLSDFGEEWSDRTLSSVMSMYESDAGIGDERQAIGDIFYTLGSENVLPALHVFHENLEPSNYFEAAELDAPVETMYNHGFIHDEPYHSADWRPENDILTERGDMVYEEIVAPDYQWLENSGHEL